MAWERGKIKEAGWGWWVGGVGGWVGWWVGGLVWLGGWVGWVVGWVELGG
jgi:hypothetical protein